MSRFIRRRQAVLLLAGLLLLSLVAGGCAAMLGNPGGRLMLESHAHPDQRIEGRFDTGLYSFDDRHHLTVVLYEGPLDAPRQAMVLRVFWQPRAGATPIDAHATNATVHYLLFSDATGEGVDAVVAGGRELGVYEGAGFVYPRSGVGGETLRGEVWQADLRLSDQTAGYADRFGQARLRGSFTATRDDAGVRQLLSALQRKVHDHLGYPRLVQAE